MSDTSTKYQEQVKPDKKPVLLIKQDFSETETNQVFILCTQKVN